MILFFGVLAALGWIAGIWLPWWAIVAIMIGVALSAYKGAFDGGLESIPQVLGVGVFCAFMVLIGFLSGDTSISDIAEVVKLVFTGK